MGEDFYNRPAEIDIPSLRNEFLTGTDYVGMSLFSDGCHRDVMLL